MLSMLSTVKSRNPAENTRMVQCGKRFVLPLECKKLIL